MAIVPFKDIARLAEDVVQRRRKCITFGLPLEIRHHAMLPVRTVISVDKEWNDPHPLIRPQSALANENPNECVILVCTKSVEEAWKDIAAYGDFPVMYYFTMEYLVNFIPALNALPETYRRARKAKASARRGVLFRGAPEGEKGFQSVQKFAADHPDDYIVVSTWDTLAPEARDRLETVCDRLVLNPFPTDKGVQSYNLQIACIQAGLAALRETSVETILIARMDYLFVDPFMLDEFDVLLKAFPAEAARAYGMKGRLIVPDLGTRRYVPYHAGDMLTYGYAEDVERYWMAMEPDTRAFSNKIYADKGKLGIVEMMQSYPVNEPYFAQAFMRKIGRPVAWTLEDSLAYCRDFHIVVNYVETGMFWFRKLWYNRIVGVRKPAEFMTHSLWLALASGKDLRAFADVDIHRTPWDSFLDTA